MATTYAVVGPAAVLRDVTGKTHYLYQGSIVPDGFPESELARLVELELIAGLDAFVAPVTDEVTGPFGALDPVAVAYPADESVAVVDDTKTVKAKK